MFSDISQIIAKQTLPADIRDDLLSYVGCVSGAIQLDEYKKLLTEAGFPGEGWLIYIFLIFSI